MDPKLRGIGNAGCLAEGFTAPYPTCPVAHPALGPAVTVASVTVLKSEDYSCTELPRDFGYLILCTCTLPASKFSDKILVLTGENPTP